MDNVGLYFWLLLHAAVGAAILWAKLRKEQRKVYGLTEIMNQIVTNQKARYICEIFIFVLIGSFISVSVLGPATAAQAFAGGLGWTGLTSGRA